MVYKTISKEELEAIKQKNAVRKKLVRKRLLIVYSILAVLTVYGAIHLYQFIQNDYTLEETRYWENVQREAEERTQQYEYYLKDGDKWLSQNHYSNAIFQYKKALEVKPSDFIANFHLAAAYTFSCQVDQVYCAEARELIKKLMKAHPENKELFSLLEMLQED